VEDALRLGCCLVTTAGRKTIKQPGRFTPGGPRPGPSPALPSGGSPALRPAVLGQRGDSAVAGRRHHSGGWGAKPAGP